MILFQADREKIAKLIDETLASANGSRECITGGEIQQTLITTTPSLPQQTAPSSNTALQTGS